ITNLSDTNCLEIHGASLHLVDDADFMSAFIRLTINHICHNFEKFTTQEGNQGNLTEVNFEEVAERLVRNAWVFC
ncbi:hypothetical protein ACS0TN_26010, partial [Serratia marcescens]